MPSVESHVPPRHWLAAVQVVPFAPFGLQLPSPAQYAFGSQIESPDDVQLVGHAAGGVCTTALLQTLSRKLPQVSAIPAQEPSSRGVDWTHCELVHAYVTSWPLHAAWLSQTFVVAGQLVTLAQQVPLEQ